MKKIVSICEMLLLAASMLAQTYGLSAPISVKIVKEVIPPNLDIVPGSVQFVDRTGNQAIDADETCYIRFQIKNSGRGDGVGCRLSMNATGTTEGISVHGMSLPTIASGKTVDVEVPVYANMYTQDGELTFHFQVTEPQGFGSDESELTVSTRAFVNPYLQIVDYSVTGEKGSGVLQKKLPFDLQLLLQNTKYGRAENVRVSVSLPEGVWMTDGEQDIRMDELKPGETKSLVYQLVVNNQYSEPTIPVNVKISEKYGRYSENRTIRLQLNQALAVNKLKVQSVEQKQEEIEIAFIGSAVDKNIPHTGAKNNNTFVLIFANEQYHNVEPVPYAMNDGAIFKEYCVKTLGINEKHIRHVSNATLNQMRQQVTWLENMTEVFDDPSVIVYYAGHGVPDEQSKSAYLLPVDGDARSAMSGYKLDDLYAELGKMPASRITVFVDACFSGSKRENGMLASARGVAIKSRSGVPQGNMVVFTAAQSDETAYPAQDQGHGMFTYYVLKKLQETEGRVTLQELYRYVNTQVRKKSLEDNSKSQTPTVTASPLLGDDWQTWTLR